MGVWNEICGITQMPICGGDKVRMFLIIESEYYRNDVCHTYTTSTWKPFGFPLKGNYDEYGRIENIEEDMFSNLLLESLKKIIVEVPNRMGEVFKRETLDWKTAIDFLTDEGLRITDSRHLSFIDSQLEEILKKVKDQFPQLPDNGWSSERSNMADEQKKIVNSDSRILRMYHMMVHEDIYQALTKKYKAPSTRFGSWTEGNLREELELGAKQYLAEIRSDLSETSEMSEIDQIKFSLNKISRRYDTDNRFVLSANRLNDDSGTGLYLRKYLDLIEEKIKNGASDDDLDIKNLIDQFIDFICFNQAMCLLRKMWSPQCGKGGQDREYSLHKFLGETIVSFSEKKIKEWDDEDIEESDEQDAENAEENE